MHVVIVANAPELDARPYLAHIQAADLLIAADGGALALLRAGCWPSLVIGDMDSLAESDLRLLAEHGAELRRFPREKDETDLELALLAAVARGATAIDVLGALGGRWDHSLANVALLALPELAACRVRLLAERQMLFLVRESAPIEGRPGDTISLLPLTAAVHGVTTEGLQYALTDATLKFEHARGVSNVLRTPPGRVALRTGLLLVVQHDDGGAHQAHLLHIGRG